MLAGVAVAVMMVDLAGRTRKRSRGAVGVDFERAHVRRTRPSSSSSEWLSKAIDI